MRDTNDIAEMHWKHDLLGSIEVGIVVVDRDYRVVVWNQFMENHSSIVPSMIRGKSLFDSFSEIDENWLRAKAEPVFSLKSPVFVIWEQRPYLFHFGANRPITSPSKFMYQNITIFPLASLSGHVDQMCIIVYDVTDQAVSKKAVDALNIKLEQLSRVDGLTEIFNRRYWEEQLSREFKRNMRSPGNSSVIMLDIDHFKKINDTYGHPAGDEVIRQLAKLISHVSRETDICGRYGGEEFTILLPDTAAENVMVLAQRIRQSVEKLTIEYEQQSISFTVSVGIAQFDPAFEQHTQWLERVDKALYQAKTGGRNQVVIA
ncbi:GGDEF domain-containing protein [Paraglaciecola sp. L1A13]|uniref:GGDEF domain-containing protein n=1 Tax=Paraglaciecola sp. L1A13 TaxID=2686359 RepID=UPI00131ADBDF|nr:GGDEF domain-containing protein [Paraglaciecola sp. L1A13]